MKYRKFALIIATLSVSVFMLVFVIKNIVYQSSDKDTGGISHEGGGGSSVQNVSVEVTTPDFVDVWNKLSSGINSFTQNSAQSAVNLVNDVNDSINTFSQEQSSEGVEMINSENTSETENMSVTETDGEIESEEIKEVEEETKE